MLPEEVEELFELSEKEQAASSAAAVNRAMYNGNLVMFSSPQMGQMGLFDKNYKDNTILNG